MSQMELQLEGVVTHNGFTRIDSIEQLKDTCTKKSQLYRLLLNFGVFSRRTIKYDKKTNMFKIKTHVSNTKFTCSPEDLKTEDSMIVEGINAQAFWMEP